VILGRKRPIIERGSAGDRTEPNRGFGDEAAVISMGKSTLAIWADCCRNAAWHSIDAVSQVSSSTLLAGRGRTDQFIWA
jgi:hypothetical protein